MLSERKQKAQNVVLSKVVRYHFLFEMNVTEHVDLDLWAVDVTFEYRIKVACVVQIKLFFYGLILL